MASEQDPGMPTSKALAMSCPVCGGCTFTAGMDMYDDRYGEPNRYCLATCDTCGHLATAPRLAESELPDLYETYYPRKEVSVAHVQQAAAG